MEPVATFPKTPGTWQESWNSEFDQRRALIFTYIYALPSPKLDGALGYALKDWQVSGTTTLRNMVWPHRHVWR